MNTRDHENFWFCQFIEIDSDRYICAKCGVEVRSEDGPPPLLCSVLPSPDDNTQTVPFSQKVKNFIASATEHLSKGAKLCSDQQIESRYRICSGCEHFLNSSCSKCGCPIVRNKQFISKLSWASSECPVGKWGQEI